MPLVDGAPFLVTTTDLPDERFVLAFSDFSRMQDFVFNRGVSAFEAGKVTDPQVFIQSAVEGGCRIMVDPYYFDGRARFKEIILVPISDGTQVTKTTG